MNRDTFCSYCGTAFEAAGAYPRTCGKCKTTIWANPIPVAVVLVPIVRGDRTGLLVVRRGIEPGKGKLALVGGFVEEYETWQAGGAREVREEVGVTIDASRLEPFYFVSTAPKPNRVLLFSIAPDIQESALAPFVPNAETMERAVTFADDGFDAFAFPLHAEAARRFFHSRQR
ncbi:MAG TPA: NUDIX domain-containing protein [Polyangiaceae bacterium]|jgi:NADH pyrophosphatase NudC (nudix superfamily)|nr:NUDIX domain-containing protein [Polyangiaceae bacterium]